MAGWSAHMMRGRFHPGVLTEAEWAWFETQQTTACPFTVMAMLHYTLDNISMMALILCIGFVVDDAIVMLENIVRHIEAGMPVREAAFKGSGDVILAVGTRRGDLGQSLWLRECHGREEGPPPPVDLVAERKTGDLIRCLVFLVRMARVNTTERPRSRYFIDFLRATFPQQAAEQVAAKAKEEDGPRLIIP